MSASEIPILLIKKAAGTTLLVLGFIIAALGFGAGVPAFGVLGVLIAMAGLVVWALKIVRRNRETDA